MHSFALLYKPDRTHLNSDKETKVKGGKPQAEKDLGTELTTTTLTCNSQVKEQHRFLDLKHYPKIKKNHIIN